MLQLPLIANGAVHVFVWEKLADPELTLIALMLSVAVPEFVSVTLCGVPAEPTLTFPKLRVDDGENETNGAFSPVPERETL